MITRRAVHEQNRRAWNQATRLHDSHKGDQARYLREGGSTLFEEELALLGDLTDLELLHLQCNSGQDTLSLVQRGAVATGVDISDTAIETARRLSQASLLHAEFVRQDVYEFLDEARRAGRRWDVVFSSYGFLPWLSDLGAWARGVHDALRPGGRLVLVEFHPVAMMMDDRGRAPAVPYSTRGLARRHEGGVGDYVAASGEALVPWGYERGLEGEPTDEPCLEFSWGLGELLGALLATGLRLTRFEEHGHANGCRLFEGMVPLPGRRWGLPPGVPAYPLQLGLVAVR